MLCDYNHLAMDKEGASVKAVLGLLAWSLGSCLLAQEQSVEPRSSVGVERALATARQTASGFVQELMATLLRELQSGGTLRAVAVCAEKAPELARGHSRAGLQVRRVSQAVRNPANRPDAFEARQLETWERQLASGQAISEIWEVVTQDGQRALRYLRPIKVADLCLRCHGNPDQLEPALVRLLQEKYPQDQAVGYKVGDLRGAVSVTIRLDGE